MERLGRPFYGVQGGSASAEDEARLLQGHESTRGLSDPIVRLSRLYVSGRDWRFGTAVNTVFHSCPQPARKR